MPHSSAASSTAQHKHTAPLLLLIRAGGSGSDDSAGIGDDDDATLYQPDADGWISYDEEEKDRRRSTFAEGLVQAIQDIPYSRQGDIAWLQTLYNRLLLKKSSSSRQLSPECRMRKWLVGWGLREPPFITAYLGKDCECKLDLAIRIEHTMIQGKPGTKDSSYNHLPYHCQKDLRPSVIKEQWSEKAIEAMGKLLALLKPGEPAPVGTRTAIEVAAESLLHGVGPGYGAKNLYNAAAFVVGSPPECDGTFRLAGAGANKNKFKRLREIGLWDIADVRKLIAAHLRDECQTTLDDFSRTLQNPRDAELSGLLFNYYICEGKLLCSD